MPRVGIFKIGPLRAELRVDEADMVPPLVRQLGSEKPEWAADPEGLARIGPADAFYNAAGVRYAAETWG